jgi:predicted NBD/HSP70 family sugar kinase
VATRGRPGTGTNQEAIRRHNLGTVLTHLHRHGQLSRAELTARMRLNRSTIAALVGELEALGAVRQTVPSGTRAGAGAGRPSLDVQPAPERVAVLATEVRVDGITVARVGLGGRVMARTVSRTPASPLEVARHVAGLMRDLWDAEHPPVGIGVSVPGIVNEHDGLVRSAPNLGWTDVPFAELLTQAMATSLHPTVANDADLGAWAEHTRGEHDDLVYLNGDVGVGGGVVAAGAPLRGAGGYAGEVGHLTVTPAGRVCRCGSRGCWETEVGTPVIAAALGHPDADPAELVRRLREVTEPSPELQRVGTALGSGLASVINVFNPERVVLGGILGELYPAVRQAADEALQAGVLRPHLQQVRIVLPCMGDDTILLGAAERAFHDLLADPVAVLAATIRQAAEGVP